MGYFCLPLGDSKVEAVKALAGNAKLWLEHTEHNKECLDYLLDFMQNCLDEARKRDKLLPDKED
jgi:hypothetical protein